MLDEKKIKLIKDLKELLDSGVLTQEQFEIEKEKILNESTVSPKEAQGENAGSNVNVFVSTPEPEDLTAIKCPNCSSNDLIINGDTAECKHCGAKTQLNKGATVNTNVSVNVGGASATSPVLKTSPFKDGMEDVANREKPKGKEELLKYYGEILRAMRPAYFFASFDKQLTEFEKDPCDLQMIFVRLFAEFIPEKIQEVDAAHRSKVSLYASSIKTTLDPLDVALVNGNASTVSAMAAPIHSMAINAAMETGEDYDSSKLCIIEKADFENLIAVGNAKPEKYYEVMGDTAGIICGFIFLALGCVIAFIFGLTALKESLVKGIVVIVDILVASYLLGFWIAKGVMRSKVKRMTCKKCKTMVDIYRHVKFERGEINTDPNTGNGYYVTTAIVTCPRCQTVHKYTKKVFVTIKDKKGKTKILNFLDAARDTFFFTDSSRNDTATDKAVNGFFNKTVEKKTVKKVYKKYQTGKVGLAERCFLEAHGYKIDEDHVEEPENSEKENAVVAPKKTKKRMSLSAKVSLIVIACLVLGTAGALIIPNLSLGSGSGSDQSSSNSIHSDTTSSQSNTSSDASSSASSQIPNKPLTKQQFMDEAGKFTAIQVPKTLKIEEVFNDQKTTAVVRFGDLSDGESDLYTYVSGDYGTSNFAIDYLMNSMRNISLAAQQGGTGLPDNANYFMNPYAMKYSGTNGSSSFVVYYEWDEKGNVTVLNQKTAGDGWTTTKNLTFTPSGSYTSYSEIFIHY